MHLMSSIIILFFKILIESEFILFTANILTLYNFFTNFLKIQWFFKSYKVCNLILIF